MRTKDIRSAARRRAGPPAAAVTIERIGAEGDGIGRFPDGTAAYVPMTLPGEVVTAEPLRSRGDGWLARAGRMEVISADRVPAPCPQFGQCGGCSLQHWRPEAYTTWKRGLLEAALRRAGFTAPPPPTFVRGHPGTRRRMDFAVRRDRGGITVGLHATASAEVVSLPDCLVLHPDLVALLEPLRSAFGRIGAIEREASLIVNLLDSGPDILLRTDAALSQADRVALVDLTRAVGAPRWSWARRDGTPEPVCAFRPAIVSLSGVEVRPPPGAFLQATRDGEAAIVSAVLDGLPVRLPARGRIAELYAGCGTLSFALARRARVAAFEGDRGALAALRDAANHAGLSGRIEPVGRDLARQPLSAKELGAFAAVVLDPPHAGAEAQIGQIAASLAPVVIYVSCNPATLARDAARLREAGYGLAAATAIDQFLWSSRLECVCVFRR